MFKCRNYSGRLRRAQVIDVRDLVDAGNRAVWCTAFFCNEFATDVVDRVSVQRLGGITTLLRTVVHQSVFADVQVSRSSAAAPVIRLSVRNGILKGIEAKIVIFVKRLHAAIDFTLCGAKWLEVSTAVVDYAAGRS